MTAEVASPPRRSPAEKRRHPHRSPNRDAAVVVAALGGTAFFTYDSSLPRLIRRHHPEAATQEFALHTSVTQGVPPPGQVVEHDLQGCLGGRVGRSPASSNASPTFGMRTVLRSGAASVSIIMMSAKCSIARLPAAIPTL